MVDIVIKVAAGSSVRTEHAAAEADEGIWVDGVKAFAGQQATIADLAAITGGESPTEAEHNLVVSKVNAILAALETAGIFASA
jgi:hypothetical protein